MFHSSKTRICKACGLEFPILAPTHIYCSRNCQMKQWKTANEKRYSEYRKKYKESFADTWEKWIQQLIYQKERRHLDIKDLIGLLEKQKYRCALSGIELTKVPGEKYTNISIDRIDQTKGYTLDNIRFICNAVNVMRWTMNDSQLLGWCDRLIYERNRRNFNG